MREKSLSERRGFLLTVNGLRLKVKDGLCARLKLYDQ